ncbi:RNA helicase NPH-II [BeAn 58058 virus]|uniref:RNA helicase NPH-II n=1 Tax=BeAn 58058 virus TaxID=67082 RepID=UPI00090B8A7E|nr:RNA helicase NPH-II [BeAn 58058 virus]APG58264.1 RNA helicase NPH-II [BeAn 58058 virus]
MSIEEKGRFAFAIFPLIKHRWKNSFTVIDKNIYRLNVELKAKEYKRIKEPIITSLPNKIDFKNNFYVIDNIKISFECYSFLKYSSFIDISLFDEYLLRGLVDGGNKLNIFTNNVGNIKNTIGIFGNKKHFSKITLKSLYSEAQNEIFKAWISNKPFILTGGTGVGKTSQVPKLLLWFNYLFGGFIISKNINNFNFDEKPIVLSLPRIALVKLHSKTLLSSIGFDEINESPISLKFSAIEDELINHKPKSYGIVFSTHKLTLSKLFDYSTVIIDEVHEHDQTGDIIIAVSKKHINKLHSLCLMTATLEDDRERIIEFFKDPIFVHIPGNTLFEIDEVYIKNKTDYKNKIRYIEEEKKNILYAINRYTPPKKSSGIIFVSTISQCESYKNYLSKYLPYDLYIIHGKINNIEHILSSIYSSNNVSIIVSTPYLESSITVKNVSHIYDTGRVYLPSPYGGREVFISKSMREQRKGRVGRVKPGTYIYFYNLSLLSYIKRIDSEFLHNYILYGRYYGLNIPEDLFIIPTNKNIINNVIEYINSFNISDSKWFKILSSYYIHILEYAKIYAIGGIKATSLDIFERENILNDEALNSIKSLNMKAKIIRNKKNNDNTYTITCKLMFGIYSGTIFNVIHKTPLFGYITMITERTFIIDS